MAAAMRVFVATTVVSLLLLKNAAADGDENSHDIQVVKCQPLTGAKTQSGTSQGDLLATAQIIVPMSKIGLKCPSGATFLPPLEANASVRTEASRKVQNVYADPAGKIVEQLSTAIPGASGVEKPAADEGGGSTQNQESDSGGDGSQDENDSLNGDHKPKERAWAAAAAKQGAEVILEFLQLPNANKTIYLHCAYPTAGEGAESSLGAGVRPLEEEGPTSLKRVCAFAVTVKSPPPQGPQSCVVPGTTVHLGIPGEGHTTEFTCGAGRELSPTDAKKAYSDDCTTEEDLKDMTFTTIARSVQYYELRATKKPSKKTICYLCTTKTASSREAETCAIMIALSGSSRLSVGSVFGATLPCFLAMLHAA